MLKANFRLVSLILLLILLSNAVFAALPGTLDTTFGPGGTVFTVFDPYNAPDPGNDIVVQPDGKIIVGGSSLREDILNGRWVMVRYNPDGSLDTTFGAGGKVVTPMMNQSDLCDSIALQPDGKIVAAGMARFNAGDFFDSHAAIARFNADGSLDATFGSGGKTLTPLPGNSNYIHDVVVLANGKIFAAGYTFAGTSFGILYNSGGGLETTFDGDGIVDIGANQVTAVASQPDGKVLIAGEAGGNWTIWRFNTNGSPDTTFDGDGILVVQIGAGASEARGILVKPDGKILTVGTGFGITNDVALAQFNPNGSFDTAFDGDGKVFFDVSGGNADRGMDLALQPNGKIVALGASGFTFEVIRLHANGALDKMFAGDGSATITVGNIPASAVAIQPDGKIVATGSSRESDFGTVRFNGGDLPIADFDGDAKTDISIFRPSNGQWWLNRSTAGIYAATFGNGTDKITPGDFTGDGKTDIAFWRGSTGEWFVLRSEDGSYFSHPFGTAGDIPAPGDFDADGKTDEAVFRPSTATWYVLKSSGGVLIQQFGATGDLPVVGDYDGDEKADIAIFRPSTGDWWIQRSTAGQLAFMFGTSTDKQVQGDFTGDGKTDAAFYRPSTGFWYVLRSEDYSFYSFPFGASGDIPAPGDYDGDGQFDAAVFRPSGATWYVRRSTAGVLIQNFGASGDVPVPSAFVP